MDEASKVVGFNWTVDSVTDVVGLVIIAVLVVILVVVLAKSGNFKLPFYKTRATRKGEALTEHDRASLAALSSKMDVLLSEVMKIEQRQDAQDHVLDAQSTALDVILGQYQGEKKNGQFEIARSKLTGEIGYYKGAQAALKGELNALSK